MKFYTYFLVVLLYSISYLFSDAIEHNKEHQDLLVIVLMVKNEETVMRKTLQPFIDAGINSFFIFDTGSTDRTIEVTQQLFDEYQIKQGYIRQEPFIDFATSRNRALDLAEEMFPDAVFMLMLDAEWYLNDARALLEFCQTCLDRGDRYPSYLVHIINASLDNYTCRLIRAHWAVRFAGVVHETIMQQTHIKVPDTIFFEYLPESIGIEKTQARFIRDRELLLREYQKNPHDTRTLFYLARTCEDLGNLEEAYSLYKIRIEMIGWDQEDFIVRYRLAETIKKLILYDENEAYQWQEALEYYLQAYQMRPHRIEPLIGIADYYVIMNQMDLAYLFAKRATEIEYPINDILFVEKYLYTYYRYELLARCSWYISEFEHGEWAANKAYQAYPNYKYARINMACYLSRKEAYA